MARTGVRSLRQEVEERVGRDAGHVPDVGTAGEARDELRAQGDHVAHVEQAQVAQGGLGVEAGVVAALEGIGRGV